MEKSKGLLGYRWNSKNKMQISRKEKFLAILGLAFLVAFSLPAFYSTLNPHFAKILDLIQWFVWTIFAVDFIVEFKRSKEKNKYFVTHLLDFIAIFLPLFRPLRLLRLISIG